MEARAATRASASPAAGWTTSQLDNTGNAAFRTPSFFGLDAHASALPRALGSPHGEPRLRVQATNLLNDHRLWPGGYSYLYLEPRRRRAATRSPAARYYYPLATRSVFVTLDVRF